MVVNQSTCQMKMESGTDGMSSNSQQMLRKKIMVSTVLDSFTKIIENTERDRVKGTIILLKHINQNQDLESKENELKYALVRLMRGLGSSRINAQKGFYAALVTLLSTTPSISADEIILGIKKQLRTTGNDSKREKGDVYFGQILACGATIRSGAFFKYSLEDQQYIIKTLISAGEQRNYLKIAAYTFLYDIIEKTNEEQFQKFWFNFDTEVGKPWAEQSMETILFLFLARDKYPEVVNEEYLYKYLGSPEILTEDTIKPLCDLLVGVPKSYSRHPIYKRICTELSSSSLVKQWCLELDSHLLKPSRSKLVTALNMMALLIPNIESSDIPELLTPNLLQSTIKHMQLCKKNKNDEQVKDIKNMFRLLLDRLKREDIEDDVKILVLQKIMMYPGDFMFENITGIKMNNQVVATLNAAGVEKFGEFYRKIISAEELKTLKDGHTVPWTAKERVQAAGALNRLLLHPKMNNNSKWQLEQILFLFQLGIVADPENKYNIGIRLAAPLKDCYQHALDLKFSKLDDLCNLLTCVVDYINDILSEPNGNDKFRTPLSDETIESWNKMLQVIAKVQANKNKKFLKAKPVFRVLLLHMGLQLFFDDKLARASIDELSSCYDRIKSENLSEKSDAENTNEPLWIEVLVDLFLNLLSHNSHWMRSVVRCVFPHLCAELNRTAIEQILNVLDPEQTQNPLLDNQSDEDSDDEESDKDSDNDQSDSDDNENSENEVENGSDASAEEDSDVDVDSDDEKETVTDKLRMAVQQALGTSGNETDNESVDLDDISENEGERLNTALSAAFKIVKENKKAKSKKQSKTDVTLTHFRVRVLDLIGIYFESQPPVLSVLEIILGLFKLLEFAIRDAHQKPLEMKIRSTFNRISNLKKMSNLDEVTEDIFYDFMKSFLDKGTKSTWIFQNMTNEITISCLFIIRCSQQSNNLEKIVEVMKDALESYFEKRDCALPFRLFKSCFEIIWDGIWPLLPLLIKFAFDNEKRAYRRNQALELLIVFYKNHRFLKENVDTLQAKLTPIEAKLNEKSLSVFNKDVEDNPGKFIGCLITLLHTIEKFHDQIEIKSDSLDFEVIKSTLVDFKSNVSFSKEAKKDFNKFIGNFKAKNDLNEFMTGEKKKSKQNVDGEESAENAGKKSKKNKQALKNAKKLRVEAMSEDNNESVTFDAENIQAETEKSGSKKKSRNLNTNETNNSFKGNQNDKPYVKQQHSPKKRRNVSGPSINQNFGDPNRSQNFGGPNRNLNENPNFSDPNGSQNSGDQNGRPNFDVPNGRPNFGGPNRRSNFVAPNRRRNFNDSNGNPNFDCPSRRPNFNGPNENPIFDGSSGMPNFNDPSGNPNFNGPNRRSNFDGPNRNSNFNGPNRNPNFNGPNRRSNFGGPNRNPNFNGPSGRPNFNGPNRSPDVNGSNEKPNFRGSNRRQKFGNPNGRPNFDDPNGQPNFNGPNRRPNFNVANGSPNVNGPNGSPNFNAPNFHRPNKRQNFDGPNGRQNNFNRKQNFNGKRKNVENDHKNSKKMRN